MALAKCRSYNSHWRQWRWRAHEEEGQVGDLSVCLHKHVRVRVYVEASGLWGRGDTVICNVVILEAEAYMGQGLRNMKRRAFP